MRDTSKCNAEFIESKSIVRTVINGKYSIGHIEPNEAFNITFLPFDAEKLEKIVLKNITEWVRINRTTPYKRVMVTGISIRNTIISTNHPDCDYAEVFSEDGFFIYLKDFSKVEEHFQRVLNIYEYFKRYFCIIEILLSEN